MAAQFSVIFLLVITITPKYTECQSANNAYGKILRHMNNIAHVKLSSEEMNVSFHFPNDLRDKLPVMSVETLRDMLQNINSETGPSLQDEFENDFHGLQTHLDNLVQTVIQLAKDGPSREEMQDVKSRPDVRYDSKEFLSERRFKRSINTTMQTKQNSSTDNKLNPNSSALPTISNVNLLNTIMDLLKQSTTLTADGSANTQNQGLSQILAPILNTLIKDNPLLTSALESLLPKGIELNTMSSNVTSNITDTQGMLASLGKLLSSNTDNGSGISQDVIGNLLSGLNGRGDIGSIFSMLQGLVGSIPGNKTFNVSGECAADIQLIMDGLDLSNPKGWALRMADALGKPAAGLMDGGIKWWGAYDQCLRVGNDDDQDVPFKGKYCLGTLKIPPAMAKQFLLGGPSIGLCMPDTCSSADVKNAWDSVLSGASLSIDVECQEPQEYDTKAIVALTICGFFLALMCLSTLFDVFMVETERNKYRHITTQSNGNAHEFDVDPSNGNERNLEKGFSQEDETDCITKNNGIQDISQNTPDFTKNSGFGYSVMNDKGSEEPNKIQEKIEYNPGRITKIFLSFSVYSNAKKILNTKQPGGALGAINGIRFISMTWVILGHTIAFGNEYVNNAGYVINYLTRFSFMAISNAEVSVDTFFSLSGLLLTYLFLKEMKREKGRVNWFMFYFHRFWRLTPVYMLVMMIDITLSRYFYNGPTYPKNGFEPDFCESHWWHNLIYINNFFQLECFGWSWYLANDMQFYVVSPLMLVPLFFWRRVGKVVVGVFLLGMTISSITVSAVLELPATVSSIVPVDFNEYFLYYVRPYCRMGPYIVGIITGYVLYSNQCKVKINKAVNIFTWLVATLMACIVLYGTFEESKGNKMTVAMAAIYNGTSRTIWGACVCWVIFACSTGHGGIINKFLSWKAFIPLGRLTYCAYLVHPIVMYTYYAGMRQPIILDEIQLTYLFCGHLVLSYGVAFITSLAFEAPMMGLEKAIFRK